ncbi:MAG: cysteine--tRNA ligase [Candidatus Aureabacteria bacterium]|nr:cysteine--tRNA ligase [Candidatus Auribacterota bacterium]
MTQLFIYNTLSRQKEIFNPVKPGEVSMYVCGPTVYDYCHLGHARAAVSFDTVFRFLKYLGYQVTYVRNLTDVDDKIIKRSREEMPDYEHDPKEACRLLSEKYTHAFHEDMLALNLLAPTMEPRATEHIQEMIRMIEVLLKNGQAYNVGGNVYFDVSCFHEYGSLSGRNMEEMETHSRLEEDPDKKNPLDFALWKKSIPGEPFWEASFGNGRPGWHIECSAMSTKYLGDTFDLHGGGQDLIFPHHENEICQSRSFSGKRFAVYWMHNGMITIHREKMSKSLKNFKLLRELFIEFRPRIIKFYLLSTHYRSPLDFDPGLIAKAGEGLERIDNTLSRAKAFLLQKHGTSIVGEGEPDPEWVEALCDDFNTPKGLGAVFSSCTRLNTLLAQGVAPLEEIKNYFASILKMMSLLGLEAETDQIHTVLRSDFPSGFDAVMELLAAKKHDLADHEIHLLVAGRGLAKLRKDFKLADEIRNHLTLSGIELRDAAQAFYWKRNH